MYLLTICFVVEGRWQSFLFPDRKSAETAAAQIKSHKRIQVTVTEKLI